jgi:hypothetical protein
MKELIDEMFKPLIDGVTIHKAVSLNILTRELPITRSLIRDLLEKNGWVTYESTIYDGKERHEVMHAPGVLYPKYEFNRYMKERKQ